jgi:serpin B
MKARLLIAPIAAVVLVLAGCANGAEIARSDKQRVTAPNVDEAHVTDLVNGNSEFAFGLYQAIREEGDNLFYSPYSISLALAMTYAGARGETEQQMADTLHFDLPQDRLHPAFNALDLELASRGQTAAEEEDRFQLNIANSIWGQAGYSFLPEFVDVLGQNYGAGLRALDFAQETEKSRGVINDWVRDETEGNIKDLLQPGVITPDTRLVLANAIYFNASWRFPFPKGSTHDGVFYLLDGSEVSAPMMNQTERFGYAQGDGYQAVELPYARGKASMLILLSDAGRFQEFESSLDAERLDAILQELESRNIALTMPRFSYDLHLSLAETLEGMGMHDAFGGAADFSAMTGGRDLFIGAVEHKAFVSVDEIGTEAAAATAVVMLESERPSPIELTIDDPFIFLIRDTETRAILFVGRVLDPSV